MVGPLWTGGHINHIIGCNSSNFILTTVQCSGSEVEVVNLKSHVFTFPDQILREVVFEYWFYIALGAWFWLSYIDASSS